MIHLRFEAIKRERTVRAHFVGIVTGTYVATAKGYLSMDSQLYLTLVKIDRDRGRAMSDRLARMKAVTEVARMLDFRETNPVLSLAVQALTSKTRHGEEGCAHC